MEWSEFLREDMGWAACIGLAAEVARRVFKGDLVLGREYKGVVEEANKAVEKADKAVERQASLSEQTIASQAEVIKALREGAK